MANNYRISGTLYLLNFAPTPPMHGGGGGLRRASSIRKPVRPVDRFASFVVVYRKLSGRHWVFPSLHSAIRYFTVSARVVATGVILSQCQLINRAITTTCARCILVAALVE